MGRLQFPDVAKLELDELIDQLVDRANDVKRVQGRLRSLLQAIETVNGELTLEAVLRHVVEAGVELADARYGALGVIGQDGTLEQFVHVGMDDRVVAAIGSLPQGRGLLGALVDDPRPIRLPAMTDDARSVGFPPNHPGMTSFLGVPIHVRDEVFGNLYLADSVNGEFSAEDEQLVSALALAAGTAVSNARLYDESRRQQQWLEASLEIGAQLLTAVGEDPLRLVAARAYDIAKADLVVVGLVGDDDHMVVETACGDLADAVIGRRFALADSYAGQALAQGRPVLYSEVPREHDVQAKLTAVIDTGPLMIVPLSGTGAPRGVLGVARLRGGPRFTDQDLAMVAGFATHASVALELADSRAAERRLLLLEERDRIAMDLHDHVIQELFAIGLGLEGLAAQSSDESTAERLRKSVEDVDRTIRRIRTSIFDLRGPLGSASEGLRRRVLEVSNDLTAALGFVPHVTFAGAVDAVGNGELADDVVACVREALTNVAKHAQAHSVEVEVTAGPGELVVTVRDDGVGMAGATRNSGIGNLRARALKWHGSCEITAPESGGTTVTWKARTR